MNRSLMRSMIWLGNVENRLRGFVSICGKMVGDLEGKDFGIGGFLNNLGVLERNGRLKMSYLGMINYIMVCVSRKNKE